MLEISNPGSQSVARTRTLSDYELRHVWSAAGQMGWPFGTVYQTLILLGQRLSEVAEVPWQELDLAAAGWIIPGARTKNKRDQFVPLAQLTIRIFQTVPTSGAKRGFVFTTTGVTPVSGFGKAKQELDELVLRSMRKEAREEGASEEEIAAISMEPWIIHDLRRTLASGCQKLGIPVEVTEAILNHISGTRAGIVGVYQTYKYADEKREALDKWQRHVMKLVGIEDAQIGKNDQEGAAAANLAQLAGSPPTASARLEKREGR